MLLSTTGLVLHTIDYAESSMIVKVFTRQLGVCSYLLNGIRGPKGRIKRNLLQPLSFLDLVVYHNPKHDINRVKDLHPASSFAYPNLDPVAVSILLFVDEVVYKTLPPAQPDPDYFDYLLSLLDILAAPGSAKCPIALIPITFLLHTAQHLGFQLCDNYAPSSPFFDLQEGRFLPYRSDAAISKELSLLLHRFLASLPQPFLSPLPPLQTRLQLIDSLLAFFRFHLPSIAPFHSHHILHSVLA